MPWSLYYYCLLLLAVARIRTTPPILLVSFLLQSHFILGTPIAWTKGFMAALASGSTIAEAIDAGDAAEDADYMSSAIGQETTTEGNRYFVGNGSIRPCE